MSRDNPTSWAGRERLVRIGQSDQGMSLVFDMHVVLIAEALHPPHLPDRARSVHWPCYLIVVLGPHPESVVARAGVRASAAPAPPEAD